MNLFFAFLHANVAIMYRVAFNYAFFFFNSGEQNFFNSSLHLPFCSSSLEFLIFFRFLLFSPTIPHLTRFEVMIFFSSRCTGFMGCLWVRGDAIKNFGALEIRFSILICEFT